MSILFVADIHLSPQRPTIVRAFLGFLNGRAQEAEALYILGDLFEAWIGDDDPSELASSIKTALAELGDKGVSVFIQRGNRDFTLGDRFVRETGATLLADEHIINDYGTQALLMHGDSLCTDDVEYQRFRKKSRHPIYLWCLVHLPLRVRQNIATSWRKKSAAANSNKASQIMDVNETAVSAVMSKHNAGTLVHGHTHRPDNHQLGDNQRIVLGDWDKLGWCLTLDRDGFHQDSFTLV